ncbi:MAG: glutathione peroxidase [Fimbriimonadaceae bacterium]|nr:glutathione peroxidase [Fimbriimonadaceae bacterium]QYK54745.1 MAG: glutathione peroxidase [Fimbriimonadaceae bacterium]
MLALALVAGTTIYDFKVPDIDGSEVSLSRYKGKVLLVVNVASRCGLTPQYEALEALYRDKKSQGFEILAFPANDFKGQEPGSNEQIKEFCSSTYNVTFPLFEKSVVLGEKKSALYKWLIASADRHDEIEWNFAKFVIDRRGNVVARFEPQTVPNDPKILGVIEHELAKD